MEEDKLDKLITDLEKLVPEGIPTQKEAQELCNKIMAIIDMASLNVDPGSYEKDFVRVLSRWNNLNTRLLDLKDKFRVLQVAPQLYSKLCISFFGIERQINKVVTFVLAKLINQ
eukprot:gene6865-11027_t